jgi:predicted RNA-binding Zn ribbon-like protein
MIDDEDLLLAALNSTPVVDGIPEDRLVGDEGAELAKRFGGTGSAMELARLRRVRDALQRVVRDEDAAAEALAGIAAGIALTPVLAVDGIRWQLTAPRGGRLAARMLLAWSNVQRERPNRLRPCANAECNLFLIDHSRPGTARWCSMATCGNRMKVRAHADRARRSAPESPAGGEQR